MATHTFTIFLLKASLTDTRDAIDPNKNPTTYPVTGLAGITGDLFLGGQNTSTPEWVNLIQPFISGTLPQITSASRSAVMIVSHGGRFFAFVFGHGKSLLDATKWERGFGLKVTLNRVDPNGLRSIDSKTYEDLVVSTRRQTSRTSPLNNFELDIGRALVRGVAGYAATTTAFKRLVGSDALRVTTDLSFSNLPQLLSELLVAHGSTGYRTNFGWIDNISEADPLIHPTLDALLVSSLQSTGGADAYLAPADVVNWNEVDKFNFTGGNPSDSSSDLSIETYLNIANRKGTTIDIDTLKRQRIKIRYLNDPKFYDEWPIYDCLIWEIAHQGNQYALFDGRWFAISPAYLTTVNSFINRISNQNNQLNLPDVNVGETEGVYNQRVEAGAPAQFAILDCQTFQPTGAATPIEFCDLLSNSGKIIHVKKRSSSATLSHLFSQGAVSADLFLNDKTLRTSVKRKLRSTNKQTHSQLITIARPAPSSFGVIYAIIAKPIRGQWPPPLPFFSAVNLMHHGAKIEGLGFNLSLQHIRQL